MIGINPLGKMKNKGGMWSLDDAKHCYNKITLFIFSKMEVICLGLDAPQMLV